MTYIKCLAGCVVLSRVAETQYRRVVIDVPFSGVPEAKLPILTIITVLGPLSQRGSTMMIAS